MSRYLHLFWLLMMLIHIADDDVSHSHTAASESRRARCLVSRHVAEQDIEPCRHTLLHVSRDMRVAVERLADRGMSQSFLHYLRMFPARQEERCTRVPQVMEPHP